MEERTRKLGRQNSPELREKLRKEAERYRKLRNQLGLAWRGAQQEAYESWREVLREQEEDS